MIISSAVRVLFFIVLSAESKDHFGNAFALCRCDEIVRNGSTLVSMLCYAYDMLRVETRDYVSIRYLKKRGTIMITQKHEEEIQQSAQPASPVEEKQTATSIEKKSKPIPASPQRWIQVLLPILGVALPLVAGSMISWPWGVGDIFDAEWVLWTVVVATCLLVFIGATLLRSQWALLIVPVAWIGGEFLGDVVRPLVEGGGPALQAETHFWDVQGTIIPFGLLPVIPCTLFGTALGTWLKERQQRR